MVLDLLLPTRCPACDTPGPAPCGTCWRELKPAPPGPPPENVDDLRSVLLYDGAGRELVARLKYRNARSIVSWLAKAMAALGTTWTPIDLITWAPTTNERRRQRGFDQAELLARAVARHLRTPARPTLARANGPPQTGRPARERATGVSFHALAPRPTRPTQINHDNRILLVDDVCTTGATLAAAAAALRASNPTNSITVMSVTAARTPLKLREGSADA